MANIKTLVGSLVAVVAAVVWGRRARAGAGVRVQRADRDPVRQDVRQAGHCAAGAGAGWWMFEMQVDELRGHRQPAAVVYDSAMR